MRRSLFAAAALCVFSLAAHADTLTYNVTSSFSDGGSVTGTLTLDNATGLFTAANLVAKGFPISNGTYTSIFYQGPDLINGTDLDVVDDTYGSEDEFDSIRRILWGTTPKRLVLTVSTSTAASFTTTPFPKPSLSRFSRP